jgi:hypothetical protein
MHDDIPIGEPLVSQFWINGFAGFLAQSQQRQIARFLSDSVGMVLSIKPDTDLTKYEARDLLALAIRAQRLELDRDVVGSLLALAVQKRSLLALAMLMQLVDLAIRQDEFIGEPHTKKKAAISTLRFFRRAFRGFSLLDEFEKYRREFEELAEAIRINDLWAQANASDGARASYRFIAPSLKSLQHLEASAKDFEVLKGPLFLWQSKISSSILAEVLAGEFPHFANVVGDIARFVIGKTNESDRPILLVGVPGIGKDSILRRAAQLVGRPTGEYDLAGGSDSRILKGTSKGWSSASPSHPATICARYRCANPLLVYGELDRAGRNRRNGDAHEALLGLCEPTTRRHWYDDGLGVGLDLSAVGIAFTANGISATPGALINRLRIIQLDAPQPEHVREVLLQARRRIAEERGTNIDDVAEPSPQVIRKLENAARQRRFDLRLADRVVRAFSHLQPSKPKH